MTLALEGLAQSSFATLPTPLQPAPKLGEALDLGRSLWVKRDDLTGPGLGGNKVRKLEHLLADAVDQGADCIVTVGAGQSNHARLTAILGALAGFEVHLVLGGGSSVAWEGNILLNRLAGATLHFVESEDWQRLAESLQDVSEGLREKGRRPYAVPMGGSTAVGALGYVRAYLELSSRSMRPRWEPTGSSTPARPAVPRPGSSPAERSPVADLGSSASTWPRAARR